MSSVPTRFYKWIILLGGILAVSAMPGVGQQTLSGTKMPLVVVPEKGIELAPVSVRTILDWWTGW